MVEPGCRSNLLNHEMHREGCCSLCFRANKRFEYERLKAMFQEIKNQNVGKAPELAAKADVSTSAWVSKAMYCFFGGIRPQFCALTG